MKSMRIMIIGIGFILFSIANVLNSELQPGIPLEGLLELSGYFSMWIGFFIMLYGVFVAISGKEK